MQSQKDLPWIWNVCLELELLPSNVLESARATGEKMPSSLIQREEQRFCFLFGNSGFFTKVSQFFFSLFLQFSLSKNQLLNVWWSHLFIDGFDVVLGGKTYEFLNIFGILPLCFLGHSFRRLIWCKKNAGMYWISSTLECCGSWLQDCAIAGKQVTWTRFGIWWCSDCRRSET